MKGSKGGTPKPPDSPQGLAAVPSSPWGPVRLSAGVYPNPGYPVVMPRGWERHGWDVGAQRTGGQEQGCDPIGLVPAPTLSPWKGRAWSIPQVGAHPTQTHTWRLQRDGVCHP